MPLKPKIQRIMIIKFVSVVVLLLSSLSIFSQINSGTHGVTQLDKCGFDYINDKNPNHQIDLQVNEAQIQKIIESNRATRAPNDIYTIPVVVHIFHLGEAVGVGSNISDAQINSSIQNLTDTYRNAFGNSIDTKIEFALAIRDPNCNTTTGINRIDASGVPEYTANGVELQTANGADENTLKDLSKWPTDQYMNFWIVTEIDGNNGGAGIQGYANFPGNSAYNGAVMMCTVFGYDPTGTLGYNLWAGGLDNGTPIHEVGHFLSLYHTFQGDNNGTICPGNTVTGNDSDGCTDTPPHIRNASNCNLGANNTCAAGNIDLVVHNFMDYSSCAYELTAEQKDRMRATLEGSRASLLTSQALVAAPANSPSSIASSCSPMSSTAANTGINGGYGGITKVTFGVVNSPTNNTAGDHASNNTTGYMDFASSCGYYHEAQLGEVINFTTDVWFNQHNLRIWVDYDNSGTFEVGENVFSSVATSNSSFSDSFTIPATATIGEYLRVRFTADLGAIANDPCHAPTFGQVEDYAIYISGALLSENNLSLLANQNISTINLKWQSDFEYNVSHYLLERSVDGKKYEKMSTVNIQNKSNYTFTDYKPLNGVNYYRITSVNINGEVVDAKVVTVDFKEEKLNVYPNPFNNQLKVSFPYLIHDYSYQIMDTYGRVVKKGNIELLHGGETIYLNLENLNEGVYFLRVETKGQVFTNKIIKTDS